MYSQCKRTYRRHRGVLHAIHFALFIFVEWTKQKKILGMFRILVSPSIHELVSLNAHLQNTLFRAWKI